VLSDKHGLTRAWSVPLSLVCTWFLPLPVCDHSQGIYFPAKRRWSIVFRILFQQTNKQTNESPVLGTPPIIEIWINLEVRGEDLDGKKRGFAPLLSISRASKPPTISESWPLKQLNPSKWLVRRFKPGSSESDLKMTAACLILGRNRFCRVLGPFLMDNGKLTLEIGQAVRRREMGGRK